MMPGGEALQAIIEAKIHGQAPEAEQAVGQLHGLDGTLQEALGSLRDVSEKLQQLSGQVQGSASAVDQGKGLAADANAKSNGIMSVLSETLRSDDPGASSLFEQTNNFTNKTEALEGTTGKTAEELSDLASAIGALVSRVEGTESTVKANKQENAAAMDSGMGLKSSLESFKLQGNAG